MASKQVEESSLNPLEREFIRYFSEAVKVFGLPKSVGEIYGLLYASPSPLSMNTLVGKLHISKGSCSQGLKILRTVNAVIESTEGRTTLYSANIELKSLIAGILKEQVQPLFSDTTQTVKILMKTAKEENDPDKRRFYQSRVSKLSTWRRRGGFVIPLVSRILGKRPSSEEE